MIDGPIHPEATRVLEKLGGDPAGFAARQLTTKIASNADLIIAMTAKHRDRVLELAPQKLKKTFTLTEAAALVTQLNAQHLADLVTLRPKLAAHDRLDVPDPIGQGADVFDTVGAQIAALLPPVIALCQRG